MDTTPDLFEAIAQLTKERDNLRTQINELLTKLQSTTESRSHYMRVAADLYLEKEQVQTKLDSAAQYVRGLEETIETCWQIAGDGNDTTEGRLGRIAAKLNGPHYALATKEDRG